MSDLPAVIEPAVRRARAIPPSRDRLQARLLIAVMLPVLVVLAWLSMGSFLASGSHRQPMLPLLGLLLGVSLTFAAAVWGLRAATPLAAVSGGLINFIVLLTTTSFRPAGDAQPYTLWMLRSGFAPMLLLFVLTFAATKAGKRRKQRAGLAESRKGRNAAQVIANLGAAALVSLPAALACLSETLRDDALPIGSTVFGVVLLAVLAEATADTVSSEIGQAFGGQPRMLTTLRVVPAGSDGAISLTGTVSGLTAAAVVVAAGAFAMNMPVPAALMAWLAGAAGLVFDSLLGATVERRGWLGNDLVNFSSTLFAALVASALFLLR